MAARLYRSLNDSFGTGRKDEDKRDEDTQAHGDIPINSQWGEVCDSEVDSCGVDIGPVSVVFLPCNVDVLPPPRMERDLLSCKHIGSSIENGLTKSIKADVVPLLGGGGWGRRGRAGILSYLYVPTFLVRRCLFSPSVILSFVPSLSPLWLPLSTSSLFFTLLCTPLFFLCLFISCIGQWTAGAIALTDLPAGLLTAALSSGLWRKKPPALKQLCRPGSERTMKNTEKKERKFNGPLGILPPYASLFLSFPLSLYLYCPLFFFISSLVHDLTKFGGFKTIPSFHHPVGPSAQ